MIDGPSSAPEATLGEIRETIERAAAPRAVTDSPVRVIGSTSPLSVAIDGPGLFLFANGARREYGRLGAFHVNEAGELVDADGRQVLGYRLDGRGKPTSGVCPIHVSRSAIAQERFSSYAIDERGIFSGLALRTDARTLKRTETKCPLAQLAIALFPAPQALVEASATTFLETAGSGAPVVAAAGSANLPRLRTHVVEDRAAGIEQSFERLWSLRRRAELQTAMAAADDQLKRVALDLVR